MKSDFPHYDVIVIGGGESGMMAAGRAAALGKRVLILEKNRHMGEKLKISGGGRCNITNAEYDERVLLKHYGKAEPYLYSTFSQFGVRDTFSFFETLGLPLVVQARKRAFPKTERALDVFRALERYLESGKVTVHTSSPVTRIQRVGNSITEVACGTKTYTGDSHIFATGGLSHPETGSTGDGFKWLRDLGHTVSKPTPTIVPLATAESWSHELSGTSLSFMKITFFCDGKKTFSKTGKILFTHFGLSGPLILNSAQWVSDLLQDGSVTATIDTYPDTDLGTLEKRIINHFDANKNKLFKTVLPDLAPEGIAPAIVFLTKDMMPSDTPVHSITREQRKV